MAVSLAQTAQEVAELRQRIAALETQVERNDDFVAGLWHALFDALLQLQQQTPEVVEGLRESWQQKQRAYRGQSRRTSPPRGHSANADELEAIATLAQLLWLTKDANPGRKPQDAPDPSGSER